MLADRCIGQAEMAVTNDQKPAGFQAAIEIGNSTGKILETDEMIGSDHAGQTETAVAQHGHGEDRIVTG